MKRIFLITLLLITAAPSARAGIRPSFHLPYCSWVASHVVVVTEGEKIDGVLTVLESWKGDLTPGDVVSVPELAEFSSESSRLVRKSYLAADAEPPRHVTGDRMILFLKEKPRGESVGKEAARGRVWEPASSAGVNVSALWVEGDTTYAFIQVMNPGPTVLVDNRRSEGEVKSVFSEVDEEHAALERAAAVKDPAARAEALEPFTARELYLSRLAAFEALRGCGRAALPTLRRMLGDETRMKTHAEVVETMTEVGGADVGEELTRLVGEELAFWKAKGPGLKRGWWNEVDETEAGNLRDRHMRLYAALRGLKKLRHEGSHAVVAELRDFWRSWPQLDDPGGLNQLSEACDEILRDRGLRR